MRHKTRIMAVLNILQGLFLTGWLLVTFVWIINHPENLVGAGYERFVAIFVLLGVSLTVGSFYLLKGSDEARKSIGAFHVIVAGTIIIIVAVEFTTGTGFSFKETFSGLAVSMIAGVQAAILLFSKTLKEELYNIRSFGNSYPQFELTDQQTRKMGTMPDFLIMTIKALLFSFGAILGFGIAAIVLALIFEFLLSLEPTPIHRLWQILPSLGVGGLLAFYSQRWSSWLGVRSMKQISNLGEATILRVLRGWSVLSVIIFFWVWFYNGILEPHYLWDYRGDPFAYFSISAILAVGIPAALLLAVHAGAWISDGKTPPSSSQ